MAKRATSAAVKASAPARAAASRAKPGERAAAVAKFKAELGHAPPKNWPVGKINGTLGSLRGLYGAEAKTVYAGSIRGASAEVRAASEAAHTASVKNGGPVNRTAHRPAMEPPAPRQTISAPKLKALSKPAIRAVSNLPHETYREFGRAKWDAGDRKAAAAVLRDYRTNTLGRNLGPVGRGFMKVGDAVRNSGAASALGVGAQIGFGIIASEKISRAYMFDGLRGAAVATADIATLGMGGGKIAEAVLGKPDGGKAVERVFPFRSRSMAAVEARKTAIEARPTRRPREALDKVAGVKSPQVAPMPDDAVRTVRTLSALAVGSSGAVVAVGAASSILKGAAGAVVKGIGMVAPKAALTASRVMPGIGLGVMAIGAGVAAVNSARYGGDPKSAPGYQPPKEVSHGRH